MRTILTTVAILAALSIGPALASGENFQGLDHFGKSGGSSAKSASEQVYRDWWNGLSRKEQKALAPTVSGTSLHSRTISGGGESRSRNGGSFGRNGYSDRPGQ